MLYWWHVIGAGPKIHGRFPIWGRIGYLIGTIPPNMLAGVAIAFSGTVIYTYYESIPRIWGFTTLQDQMLGGVIMWIPGSMMLLDRCLILLATQFKKGEEPLHASDWDSDEAMVAPGLEHRVIQNRWRELEKPRPRKRPASSENAAEKVDVHHGDAERLRKTLIPIGTDR